MVKKLLFVLLFLPAVSSAAMKFNVASIQYASTTFSTIPANTSITAVVFNRFDDVTNNPVSFCFSQDSSGDCSLAFLQTGGGVEQCDLNDTGGGAATAAGTLGEATSTWSVNACVFKSGSSLTLYSFKTDGTLRESVSTAVTTTSTVNTAKIWLGAWDQTGPKRYYTGGIRNFMIFTSALTQQQIKQLIFSPNPALTGVGSNLLLFAPLVDNSDLRELTSNIKFTTNSTVSMVDDPVLNFQY